MPWAFHCYDAVTAAPLGVVPMSSWSCEDWLPTFGSGSWSATMAPPQSTQLAQTALAATLEGRTVVVAFRDGQPLFSGFVPPGGRRTPELAGGGLLSYFDHRIIDATVTFTGVDQFTLAKLLIDTAQAAGKGIGIDTGYTGLSGVLRDQTWYDYERKNIGEALRQKAALINGFDFDIRTEVDAGQLRRRLRCWYPRRGRSVGQGGPVFRLGGNMWTTPSTAGNPDFATRTIGYGVETDPTTRARLRYAATSVRLTEGWPLLDSGLDLPDVRVLGTLQNHVDGVVAHNSVNASDEVAFDVDPNDPTWPWGSWELGDDCQVIVPAGLDEWQPDGSSQTRRIVAHRWDGPPVERLQVVTHRAWGAT